MNVTHYTGSDGKLHAIDSMAFPHLKSATLKLQGSITDHSQRVHELAAMKAELARRESEFAEAVRRFKAQGLSVEGGPSAGFVLMDAGGMPWGPLRKTEEAVWWALIQERKAALQDTRAGHIEMLKAEGFSVDVFGSLGWHVIAPLGRHVLSGDTERDAWDALIRERGL